MITNLNSFFYLSHIFYFLMPQLFVLAKFIKLIIKRKYIVCKAIIGVNYPNGTFLFLISFSFSLQNPHDKKKEERWISFYLLFQLTHFRPMVCFKSIVTEKTGRKSFSLYTLYMKLFQMKKQIKALIHHMNLWSWIADQSHTKVSWIF